MLCLVHYANNLQLCYFIELFKRGRGQFCYIVCNTLVVYKKPNGAKQSFDDRWSGNKNNNMYMQ